MRKALYMAALAIVVTGCAMEQADDSGMESQDTNQAVRKPNHRKYGSEPGFAGSAGSAGASGTGGTSSGGASGQSGSAGAQASGGAAGAAGSVSTGGSAGAAGSVSTGGSAGAGSSSSGTGGTSGTGFTGIAASCPVKMPVEGMVNPSKPSAPKPARAVVMSEPTFGTCMARATDHTADGLSGFARNDYSRRQPYNADDSYYLIYALDGSWHLYDSSTLKWIKRLPFLSGDAEPQWHPTDRNKLYYLPNKGGLKIHVLDVSTGVTQVAADFVGKLPWANAAHAWTRSEGSPSRDGRYWGFVVQDTNWNYVGYMVWDMQLNQLAGSLSTTAPADHSSMSPSGRWITISTLNGTYAYSRDFSVKKQLHHYTEHSDIAVGANGNDVYVSIDYQADKGDIFMVDIDTGVRTALTPTYLNGSAAAFHFSGKAYNKPGWVLVSAYESGAPVQWYGERVFAMQLAASPKVYELAFHHSLRGSEYFAEPHAAVNRNFTRVMFNSNWDAASSSNIDAYMLFLPAGAF